MHTVKISLHPVAGHLQMLIGMMMAVMQLFHEVCHVVVIRFSLSRDAPNSRYVIIQLLRAAWSQQLTAATQ
jgi:hypothetical protein